MTIPGDNFNRFTGVINIDARNIAFLDFFLAEGSRTYAYFNSLIVIWLFRGHIPVVVQKLNRFFEIKPFFFVFAMASGY